MLRMPQYFGVRFTFHVSQKYLNEDDGETINS